MLAIYVVGGWFLIVCAAIIHKHWGPLKEAIRADFQTWRRHQ